MDFKRIVKEYKQLYAHKFDNLDEMDQYLERHNLPKLTHDRIDNLNRPISVKEIESIFNNLPTQKLLGPVGSLMNSTKHLKNTLYQFSTLSFRR